MVESSHTSGLAELPHLATFVRAAEQGGFTAAAAELGISQAAVSQRIALLEKVLRVSLFDRRAGRNSLTEAGQRLFTYARRILDLHEQARSDVGGFHPPVSGDLPIAASSVPGECYLPALLSAFHKEHPQVHVRATVSDSSSVMKGRRTGPHIDGHPRERGTALGRILPALSTLLCFFPFPSDAHFRVPALTERPDRLDRSRLGSTVAPT